MGSSTYSPAPVGSSPSPAVADPTIQEGWGGAMDKRRWDNFMYIQTIDCESFPIQDIFGIGTQFNANTNNSNVYIKKTLNDILFTRWVAFETLECLDEF